MKPAYSALPLFTAAALLALSTRSPAAPLLEKQSLFEAGTGGYFNCRIPGLLVTKQGAVLATVEARRGRGGDWDDNDVLLRRSLDGGRSWEKPRLMVANKTYGPGPVSNFVMLSDRDSGAVHALFCHNYRRVFHIHSEDNGATFSAPVEITPALEKFRRDYPWRVVATGPDHGTQLRNGRFVVPVWMSDGSGKEMGKGHLGHRPSIVGLIYSDDWGRSWQRGEIVCRNDQRTGNPSETVMVELADGRVLFNIRSESKENRRLVSISPDGVKGWSEPRFEPSLLEPVCMAGLIRLSWPEGGRPGRILFANPDNLENTLVKPGGVWHDRKRLTVKASCDECRSWPVSKVLEEGPSGYSDLAVLPDGSVLCFYECGMIGGMFGTKSVTLAHFNLEWLTGGHDRPAVADFADLSRWQAELPAGASLSAGPDHTARLEWISKTADAPRPAVVTLKLAQAVPLPGDARRAGLWLYVQRPMFVGRPSEQDGAWLMLRDADGRAFRYRLAKLSAWAKGWRYIDTFAFGTNESGRIHPEVGVVSGGGSPIPRAPLSLVGLRLEARQPLDGQWLLGPIETSAVTRGDGNWRWGLNVPGERNWQTTSLLREGEPPYLPAGYLLPAGGETQAAWRVRAGFQGPVVAEGSRRLGLDAADVAAQGQRIVLGQLPPGKYEVEVDMAPADLRTANPEAWHRVVWHADGAALWDDQSAHGGRRSLSGEVRGGKGFAGWRQTVKVPAPGRYRLSLFQRGTCHAEAQVAAFDAQGKNVPGGATVRFKPSGSWQRGEVEMTFDPAVKSLYVSLIAQGAGRAWFDDISLKNAASEILANGDAESGRSLTRKRFTLFVLQSPAAPIAAVQRAWSVAPGESLEIPLPSWARRGARWEIRDDAGAALAAGETAAGSLSWRPPHPGAFSFCLRRMDGGLVVDEETLLVGCRTPLADLGPAEFSYRSSAASDADLFGPGRNYFTWATYEMNPSEPRFFQAFLNWVDDGRTAGFELFRVRINWNDVEPLPGVFDFTLVDRCVAAVVERGGRVVPEIVTSRTPAWVDNQLQLDAEGRADLWVHGSLGTTITSMWTPGLLEAVERFVDASVRHYRNNPHVVAYHLWGLPGCCDWPFVDKPWWGQVTDYSPASEAAFRGWSQGKYAAAPLPDPDWTHPDLRPQWRAWTQFKAYGAERFICDAVIGRLRALDDRRPVPAYYGFDFASPRIAQSAQRQNWFRHTGGCDLYYQMNMWGAEALHCTKHPWPQETGGMTPSPGELEHATWQASLFGGPGLNWNYYWREGIRVGAWLPEKNQAVAEWRDKWAPLWRELRDAQLAQPPDMAVVKTWSTMHYGLRTFFPHRLDDYCSPFAAVVYRDHLWPTWFSENCTLDFLPRQKLVVAAPGAARIMPRETADALADYVRHGGRLVLFPDSGSWVVEEPGQPGALLRRLGWTGPAVLAPTGAGEVGNSGMAAGKPVVVEARVVSGSAALEPLKVLPMTGCVSLAKAPGQLHAAFADGSPAVIGWRCGAGEVLLLAGTPHWEQAAGLFQALYHWAGGRPALGAGAPSVMVNHLVKGRTHYLLVHRGPDNLSPRQPTLDRARLEALPPLATEFFARDLPAGRWRMTDLTGNDQAPRQVTSAELAAGLPVSLHLAQTKVFRLEPASP